MCFATELASAMSQDLQALPSEERRQQCSLRCAEAWEAVAQVDHVLGETKAALGTEMGQQESALDAFCERLQWTSQMLVGLREGLTAVESLDTDNDEPGRPYGALAACLGECEEAQGSVASQIGQIQALRLAAQAAASEAPEPEQAKPCEENVTDLKAGMEPSALRRRVHPHDFINDVVAEEMKLLLEGLVWILKPMANLYELLAPGTLTNRGPAYQKFVAVQHV